MLGEVQLPNLNYLSISNCGNLRSLIINNCNNLKLSLGHENVIPKLRLKSLFIGSLPQLLSFPQWLQGCADTLHSSLVIADCENLEKFPEWSSTLICLNTLTIRDCPKLLSLPNDVHCLPNLECLEMKDCPELCRRYQPEVGHDWAKISHIKQVKIVSSETEH